MSASPVTTGILYACSVSAPVASSTRPNDELTSKKAHHLKDGGFDNPWPSWKLHSFMTFFRGMIIRRIQGKANIPDTTPPTVPVRKPNFLPSRSGPANNSLRATWLGHACYYVEYPSGLRVLFDPVFTDRCSPFSFMGPKRYTEPPCMIRDIPIIDAVVISHNHYDHLSHPTVLEIQERHPDAHFFVPLGNKKWFQKVSPTTACTEMDWWDEVDITLTPTSDIGRQVSVSSMEEHSAAKASKDTITARISCLPCQHISARTPFDRGHTLWSSWGVASGGRSVYFGGDTGYRTVPESSHGKDDWGKDYAYLPHCPAFEDVGKYRGPFDLGLIPIGAYDPRWVMSPMHANPRDAVEIFRSVKAKRAMGIHWGTWVLTEEDVLEPPKKLKEALRIYDIPETGVFDVCDIGECREF